MSKVLHVRTNERLLPGDMTKAGRADARSESLSADFPSISVVIPCYNGARFLREAIVSVLAQTLSPVEILVIDDSSIDDSAALAESYGPPVRVIRQPNQGESVARNRGIDEAQGEWIAFLDADDYWLPEKLAKQAAAMAGGAKAVCTGHIGVGIEHDKEFLKFSPEPNHFSSSWMFANGTPSHISTLLVHRSLDVRFPTWTRDGEDSIYFLELTRASAVAIVDEPLSCYRRHAQSQSAVPGRATRWCRTLDQWLRLNRTSLSPIEARTLNRILSRRRKRAMLSEALIERRDGRFFAGLTTYSQILLECIFSATTFFILLASIRGTIGTTAEIVGLKRRPVLGEY